MAKLLRKAHAAFSRCVLKYVYWRYGHGVKALRPPLGYCNLKGVDTVGVSLWYKISYFLKYHLWSIERYFFEKYAPKLP